MSFVTDLVEAGYVPDRITRMGIRRFLRQRLKQEAQKFSKPNALNQFVSEMTSSPLAINTSQANQQHYEVPTEFYEQALGLHKKYSCGYFQEEDSDLTTAEEDMLALTCQRAEVEDGMKILELGCGWGSLTLWLARLFPACDITAVSNSVTQKQYIDKTARERGLDNINVVTCDMNDFDISDKFDRIVSIEMFEHMRNHPLLFEKIAGWLRPKGKLFFHIFCHKSIPYFFETEGEADWMAKHFFTGGLMPSFDLPLTTKGSLTMHNRWSVNGIHYAKTSRLWLQKMDANKQATLQILEASDDPTPSVILYNRWRMFFMACEELFAYDGGREWHVGHYLFGKI
ncbi:MAG: cyclopropane-fatty-acyl-phospholipid synthase [Candidatus Azotimanducaceae bacterium]|jgi:cyclopropane-fatty-acyl-phospholipid synthase